MKIEYTYKIIGKFGDVWIGVVPEVPGVASYAKDLNDLIPLLDYLVKHMLSISKPGE